MSTSAGTGRGPLDTAHGLTPSELGGGPSGARRGVSPGRGGDRATAELQAGASEKRTWTFGDDKDRRGVSVGSGLTCRWQVTARGVLPLHLTLFWDGRQLWVTNVAGSMVIAGGQRVSGWLALARDSEVCFGEARLKTSLVSEVVTGTIRLRTAQDLEESDHESVVVALQTASGTPYPTPTSAVPAPARARTITPAVAPAIAPRPVVRTTGVGKPRASHAITPMPAAAPPRRLSRALSGLAMLAAAAIGGLVFVVGRAPRGSGTRAIETEPAAVVGLKPPAAFLAEGQAEAPKRVTPSSAAESFAAGALGEAARRYQVLAERDPSEPTWAFLAGLLARRDACAQDRTDPRCAP